jgi:hypothetical protein
MLSQKHPHITFLGEAIMVTNFFGAWAGLFNGTRRTRVKYEAELLTYAKTEYTNDWEYAYQHMLDNEGRGPRTKVSYQRGVPA